MLTATDISIFERLVDVEPLSPQAARGILELHFSDEDQAKIQNFGEKANEGLLTTQEREDYESYIRAGDLLAILHAKAHLALKQHGLGN